MHYSVATFNVKYFLESRCRVCNVEVKYSTKWDISVNVYGVENTKFSKVLFLESVCFCLKNKHVALDLFQGYSCKFAAQVVHRNLFSPEA